MSQLGPAGSTKPLTAMAVHLHAVLFQKAEDMGILAFVEVEGFRVVVDVDLVGHTYLLSGS